MKTIIYSSTRKNIIKCAKIIKRGEVVAFPTETVYGLGASALDEKAVCKIYAAKGRPSDNPLIVHLASTNDIAKFVTEIPPLAQKLIDEIMPAALTIVLKKNDKIPNIVTGGLDTVGLRVPTNQIARELIEASGVPICAPSANTSSRPSPTSAAHVFSDLDGKILAIIDGGDCEVGLESTIIDMTGAPKLLRAGGVSLEEIERVIGKVTVNSDNSKALCPGMKYKHYSPKNQIIFAEFGDGMIDAMQAKYDELGSCRVGVMCLADKVSGLGDRKCIVIGSTYEEYAHNMFRALRDNENKFDVIIAEGAPLTGIGLSINNRMDKACGGNKINCPLSDNVVTSDTATDRTADSNLADSIATSETVNNKLLDNNVTVETSTAETVNNIEPSVDVSVSERDKSQLVTINTEESSRASQSSTCETTNSEDKRPHKQVVFVCSGNTCRSPLVEFLFKDYCKKNNIANINILSAGLCASCEPMSLYTAQVLAERGIEYDKNFVSQPLTPELIAASDLIVCMTTLHHLLVNSPKSVSIAHFIGKDIPDPYGRPFENYRQVADAVSDSLEQICKYLI